MIELLAIGIAVAIGWGIAHGLRGHMEPEPGAASTTLIPAPSLPPLAAPKSCDDAIAALPTGSSDIDNLRNAVQKMYLVATTADDAKVLEDTATDLDAAGYTDAAACLRNRAALIRKGLLFPVDTDGASPTTSPLSSSGTGGLYGAAVFPSGDGS